MLQFSPRFVLPLSLTFFALWACQAMAQAPALDAHGYDWVVKRAQWSNENEQEYENLLRKIGEAVEGRYRYEIEGKSQYA